ncbi:MAG: hypothetical protein V1875_09765 [Candidatus Altiarchaeota archaeon]
MAKEAPGPNPIRVSKEQVMSFYEAIREAEYIVASRKPDFIVAPLRGAEPLIESMAVVADLEGRDMPEVVYIETGTIGSRIDGKPLRPLFPEGKVALVSERLGSRFRGKDGRLSICLVDEVESGGSIVKNFDYVNGAMRLYYPKVDFDLYAVGICSRSREKCGRFVQLLGMGKITPLYVDDLFTVDRTRFLSPLVRKDDDVRRQGLYPGDSKNELYNNIERIHRELQDRHGSKK